MSSSILGKLTPASVAHFTTLFAPTYSTSIVLEDNEVESIPQPALYVTPPGIVHVPIAFKK